MMRVVLDANIYISAFLKPAGVQARLLKIAADGRYRIVLSQLIFEEICLVLQRKKIADRLSMPMDEAIKDLERLMTIASWTEDELKVRLCEDPKDDIYLACAKESQADFLVSGDDHLLKIKEFEKTKIVTTVQFLDFLKLR